MIKRRKGWTTSGWPNIVFMVVSLVLIFGLLGFVFFQRFINEAEPYQLEFEGRVVDKSISYQESYMGSGVQRLLIIRRSNGSQFSVVADQELYDRAKTGMWIKRTTDGTTLTDEKSNLNKPLEY